MSSDNCEKSILDHFSDLKKAQRAAADKRTRPPLTALAISLYDQVDLKFGSS
jgi:hypothetical protein